MYNLLIHVKTLIVTASSKSKRQDSGFSYKPPKTKFHNVISEPYKQKMLECRENVLKVTGEANGPDMTTTSENTPFDLLPAYKRYSGRTFSRISPDAWEVAVKSKNVDIVILSAMYGLVRFDEPIRNYSIKQSDNMEPGLKYQTMWKKSGAKDWLFDYIKREKFETVLFVLSTSYSGIVQRDKLMISLEEDLGVQAEDHQYKQDGRRSMLLRGDFINNFLLDQL